MRISDWSSDVCSSDLHDAGLAKVSFDLAAADPFFFEEVQGVLQSVVLPGRVGPGLLALAAVLVAVFGDIRQMKKVGKGACDRGGGIGRASGWDSGCRDV